MRFLLCALLALAIIAPAQQPSQPQLPVRRLVVYKHGVGYFERQGRVTGDQDISLPFRAAQMRDVLKSLYAVDLSGGRIAAVTYDTKAPLARQLEDILVTVPEDHALSKFLTELKGARLEVAIAGERVRGSVLGVEPLTRQTTHGTSTSWKLVLFSDDGRIVPLDLLAASHIELLDEGLKKDVGRMLEVLLRAKHADRKTVVVHAEGEGDRTVRVGYLVETPIWKTSYRVLFDDRGDPLLQGWAILENTTDEDWKDVDVSFVAGSPLSFVMDLYTAYHPQRKEIPVGIGVAPAPDAPRRAFRAAAGRLEERARGRSQRDKAAFEAERLAIQPATEGMQVGELFAYQAREPVSVRRGQAALIPILSERVPGGERVLWSGAKGVGHALNAWYVRNGTRLTLESGPVTFFEGATCLGEGLLDRVLKPGMRAMLPYAVEAGITVSRESDRVSEPVTKSSIADGVLMLIRTENLVTRYRVDNRLGEERVLYLDHRRTPGFVLADGVQPVEETDGCHRFRVSVGVETPAELVVTESRPIETRVQLLGTPAETIRLYLAQPHLSADERAFLAELLRLTERVTAAERALRLLEVERARIEKSEVRIRENLGVLRDTAREAEMRARYLDRLEAAEKALEENTRKTAETRGRLDETRRALALKVKEFTS